MNHPPDIPELPQPIPTGELWLTLGLPPLVTVALTLGLLNLGNDFAGFAVAVPIPVFFVVTIMLGRFIHLIGLRYRGRSASLLAFGYFFRQFIVCLTLWMGTCELAMLVSRA